MKSILRDFIKIEASPFEEVGIEVEVFQSKNGDGPNVSFLVPVHNQDSVIVRNLGAIAAAATLNHEFIVIVDGCSDATEQLVREWALEIVARPCRTLKVTIAVTADDIFETAADSLAVSLASADFAIEIQADMNITHEGFDYLMVKALEENTDIFAISGRGIHPSHWPPGSRGLRWVCQRLAARGAHAYAARRRNYRPNSLLFKITGEAGRLGNLIELPLATSLSPRLFVGGTVIRGPLAFSRKLYFELGGFDVEKFFLGNDDHDLVARAKGRLSLRAAYLPIQFSSPLDEGSTRRERSPEAAARFRRVKAHFGHHEENSFLRSGQPEGGIVRERREVRELSIGTASEKLKESQEFSSRHRSLHETGTVLIVQESSNGHRLMYVALLAKGVLERKGKPVVALRSGVRQAPEFAVHLDQLEDIVQFIEVTDFSLLAVQRLAQVVDAERTVIPDGDLYLRQLLRRAILWKQGSLVLLIMRNTGGRRLQANLRSAAKGAIMQIFRRSRSIEVFELAGAFVGRSSKWAVNDPIVLASDPAAVDRFRERVGMDSSRYWFSLIGGIHPRKNPVMVLNALASLNNSSVGILVAGRVAQELKPQIEKCAGLLVKSGGAAIIIDEVLSNEDLDSAVHAADCVVIAHDNEGASGIMGKATAAGTRILAAGALSLRKDCRTLGDIAEWVRLTEADLSSGMLAAADKPRPQSRSASSAESFCAALLGSREPQQL